MSRQAHVGMCFWGSCSGSSPITPAQCEPLILTEAEGQFGKWQVLWPSRAPIPSWRTGRKCAEGWKQECFPSRNTSAPFSSHLKRPVTVGRGWEVLSYLWYCMLICIIFVCLYKRFRHLRAFWNKVGVKGNTRRVSVVLYSLSPERTDAFLSCVALSTEITGKLKVAGKSGCSFASDLSRIKID